jgi:Putative metal-binding motif
MKKNFAVILGLILGLSFLGASPVQALSSYLSTMNSLYGTSYSCSVCHIGSTGQQNFNSFGNDFVDEFFSNGFNDTTAFHDIEALDSDGDGYTNIDELNAHTLPGDPSSFPATEPVCTDNDNDGFFLEGGVCGTADCNDGNLAVYPGAVEDCTDGVDNDCNGLIDAADPAAVGCSSEQPPNHVGLFRNGQWRLDVDGNQIIDTNDIFHPAYGVAGDQAVAGDWDGDGVTEIGVFRNGQWRLDVDNNGVGSGGDIFYPAYGIAGDIAVTGDWNGDGITDIGVFRAGQWRLDTDNNGVGSAGDIFYPGFGIAGDLPVTGDWNGDGITDIGVLRDGQWRLDLDNNGVMNAGDIFIPALGLAGDQPVAGSW